MWITPVRSAEVNWLSPPFKSNLSNEDGFSASRVLLEGSFLIYKAVL